MRILFIIDTIDNGGVGVVMRNLLNHFDLHKYNIDILTFEQNIEYESLISKDISIKHAYIKNPAKSPRRITRYFYAVLKEYIPKWLIRYLYNLNNYDIVIDFKGNNLNVLTAAKCRKIYWCHKDFSPKSNLVEKESISGYNKTFNGKFKEKAFKRNLAHIDDVVCISQYTSDSFRERWCYVKEIKIIHNVIDSKQIINKSQEHIEYRKDAGKLTFCCLSRIAKGKGIERLLECAKILNDDGYIFELNIIGGGDSFQEVKSLYNKMNLKNVKLWGNKNNPYPYLKECDVFICPSETEAYSTVLCEAIVLGKPIVMTNVGATEEIMSKGKFGIIVDNSKDGILLGMKFYLNSLDNVKIFTRDVCNYTTCPFDIESSINEVERLFNESTRKI